MIYFDSTQSSLSNDWIVLFLGPFFNTVWIFNGTKNADHLLLTLLQWNLFYFKHKKSTKNIRKSSSDINDDNRMTFRHPVTFWKKNYVISKFASQIYIHTQTHIHQHIHSIVGLNTATSSAELLIAGSRPTLEGVLWDAMDKSTKLDSWAKRSSTTDCKKVTLNIISGGVHGVWDNKAVG